MSKTHELVVGMQEQSERNGQPVAIKNLTFSVTDRLVLRTIDSSREQVASNLIRLLDFHEVIEAEIEIIYSVAKELQRKGY